MRLHLICHQLICNGFETPGRCHERAFDLGGMLLFHYIFLGVHSAF